MHVAFIENIIKMHKINKEGGLNFINLSWIITQFKWKKYTRIQKGGLSSLTLGWIGLDHIEAIFGMAHTSPIACIQSWIFTNEEKTWNTKKIEVHYSLASHKIEYLDKLHIIT
jgi:hypothetical protein